jgi:hypothetical protein
MMLHIEFQVEEPSMEELLAQLLPRLVGQRSTWAINNYRSKSRLLTKLPDRLRGYAARLRDEPHLRVVVLIDLDAQDCLTLKRQLEDTARRAGLVTKSIAVPPAPFTVLNRIVVRELESWLLGDVPALCACYPRLPPRLDRTRVMRDPDAIIGAWEALHRQLKSIGALGGVYPKIEVARRVGQYLDPARNRSRSFQVFRAGIEALLA